LLISFLLAYLSYQFIEIPIRFGAHRQKKTIALVLAMLLISLMGLYTGYKGGFTGRPSVLSTKEINTQFVGSMWKYSENENCRNRYPFTSSNNYAWWFCVANSAQAPTLLILGSSYANQLYPGIIENDQLKHHRTLSIGTCSAQWVEPTLNLPDKESLHPCSGNKTYEQQAFINSIVKNDQSLQYVIIGGLNDEASNEKSFAALKKRIDFLESNHARVILFAPHIYPDYDIKSCFSRPLKSAKNNCEFSYSQYLERTQQFDRLIKKLKATNPEVLGFNQNDLFCNEQKCSFIIDGMPAFRDEDHHLSEYASKLLFKKYFTPWAKENIPDILQK
jgi:hypothetical protein